MVEGLFEGGVVWLWKGDGDEGFGGLSGGDLFFISWFWQWREIFREASKLWGVGYGRCLQDWTLYSRLMYWKLTMANVAMFLLDIYAIYGTCPPVKTVS